MILSNLPDGGLISVHLIIKGKVQGVYFRFTLKNVAKENNVTGWARNLINGDVEAELEGYSNNIQNVIEWSNVGPDNAKVEKIEIDYMSYSGKYNIFEIIK